MLNLEQKKAATILDKPVIVIAGPGTGKTALICEKINFLFENGFDENNILALTFTQKAAQEMSSRVEAISKKMFSAKTFHSFALELIEEYKIEFSKLDVDYKLIEEMNSFIFFIENLESFKLKSVQIKNNHTSVAQDLESSVLKLKEFGIKVEDVDKLSFQNELVKEDIICAYKKYEEFKLKNNFLDFSDILLYFLDVLKNNKKVRDEIKKRYKYILVDEFQDTNKVQLEILTLLAENNNITVVGDKKQSIYSFRGAFYENFLEFKKTFENYEEIFLHQNYRASKAVLETINNYILKSCSTEELLLGNSLEIGESKIVETIDEEAQVKFIFEKIKEIRKLNPENTIAILCRRKNELREISHKLKLYGIKHNSLQVMSFFNQEIIKEIIIFMKIINSPHESNNELFTYLQNSSLRFETVKTISRKASLKDKSIYNVLSENVQSDYEAENALIKLIKENIDYLINLKQINVSLDNLIFELISKLNLYQKSLAVENFENVFLLNKFLEFAKNFTNTYRNSSLKKFIEICELSKNSDILIQDETEALNLSKVILLTVHQAKGKEFDFVFMPYLNDRKFPAQFMQSRFPISFDITKEKFLKEEERIFFVALSRAKIGSYFLYVKRYSENKFDSKPSDFLSSLNISKIVFTESKEEFTKISSSDAVKLELIRKINSALMLNQFEDAKNNIDVMKSLFSKKDLSSFLNPNINKIASEYERKMKQESFENVVIKKETQVYSVSQLKMYESCPRKYLYGYVYKIPTSSKHFFDFGTSVHSVLENLIPLFDSNSKEFLEQTGIVMLHKFWISKGYESAIQEKEYFQKGVEAIKSFIEKEFNLREKKREVVAMEKEFLIEVNGKKIIGFIDRIDKVNDEYEILDYKTSNSMETLESLSENLQLYVYAIALKELYDKYPSKVGLWYLVHDKLMQVQIDIKNIAKIKEKIIELIDGIESNNFVAKPSFFNCTYCDFSNICNFSNRK